MERGEREISSSAMREFGGFLAQQPSSRVISDETTVATGRLDGSTVQFDTIHLPLDERDIPPALKRKRDYGFDPEEVRRYVERTLHRKSILENDPWWQFVELMAGNAFVSRDLIVEPIVEPHLLAPGEKLTTGEILAEVSPYLREEPVVEEEEKEEMMSLPPTVIEQMDPELANRIDTLSTSLRDLLEDISNQEPRAEAVEEKRSEIAAIQNLENKLDRLERALTERVEVLEKAQLNKEGAEVAQTIRDISNAIQALPQETSSKRTSVLQDSARDFEEEVRDVETEVLKVSPSRPVPTTPITTDTKIPPRGSPPERTTPLTTGRRSTGTTPLPPRTPTSEIRKSIYEQMSPEEVLNEWNAYLRRHQVAPRGLLSRYLQIYGGRSPPPSLLKLQPSGQNFTGAPPVLMWNQAHLTEDQTVNLNPLMMHFTNPEIIGYIHLTPFAKSAIQDALTALRLKNPNLAKVELDHLVKTSGDDVRNLFARLCAQYFIYNRFFSGARQQLDSTPQRIAATTDNLFNAFKRYIFNPSRQKVERLEEYNPSYAYREKNLNPFAFPPHSTQYIPAPTSNVTDWLLPR